MAPMALMALWDTHHLHTIHIHRPILPIHPILLIHPTLAAILYGIQMLWITSIPPPPPPPDSSVRPPAPPMVFPEDSSPEDSNSVEDSDGGYGLQKKVVENNSHEDAEEVEGPKPIPLNRASATERSRKGTGIPAPPPTTMNAGSISSQSVAARGTIDDVQGKNAQLARQPVQMRPTTSKDSRIDPSPPGECATAYQKRSGTFESVSG
nr:unnamed protein product [Haemonchus contortus]